MSDLYNNPSPTVVYQRTVPAATLERIAELEAENKLLTEAGQLYVLAKIREIVDPMKPERMMQSELVAHIRAIVAENARQKEQMK